MAGRLCRFPGRSCRGVAVPPRVDPVFSGFGAVLGCLAANRRQRLPGISRLNVPTLPFPLVVAGLSGKIRPFPATTRQILPQIAGEAAGTAAPHPKPLSQRARGFQMLTSGFPLALWERGTEGVRASEQHNPRRRRDGPFHIYAASPAAAVTPVDFVLHALAEPL